MLRTLISTLRSKVRPGTLQNSPHEIELNMKACPVRTLTRPTCVDMQKISVPQRRMLAEEVLLCFTTKGCVAPCKQPLHLS